MNIIKIFIRKIADFADLSLNYSRIPYGTHPLIIEGDRSRIPKTVLFNTGCGSIHIGDNTIFGDNVMLLTGKHMDIEESTSKGLPLHSVPESGYDIFVGRGCYIGSGSIIIGPCRIGDFVVISAGAVVYTDIASYTVVAGNPARAVKKLQIKDGEFSNV